MSACKFLVIIWYRVNILDVLACSVKMYAFKLAVWPYKRFNLWLQLEMMKIYCMSMHVPNPVSVYTGGIHAEKYFITTIIIRTKVKNALFNLAPKKDFVTSRKSI